MLSTGNFNNKISSWTLMYLDLFSLLGVNFELRTIYVHFSFLSNVHMFDHQDGWKWQNRGTFCYDPLNPCWIHWIESRHVIPVANNWSSKGSTESWTGVKFQQITNYLPYTFAWLSNCALFRCMISYFCSDYSFFFFIVFHCVTNACVSYISKFWHLNSDLCLVILMMPNEFHAECQFTVLIWPIHLLWGYGKEGKMWTEDILWFFSIIILIF